MTATTNNMTTVKTEYTFEIVKKITIPVDGEDTDENFDLAQLLALKEISVYDLECVRVIEEEV